MKEPIASDGRKIIFLNEPSREQAYKVMYLLVKKRLDAAVKAQLEKERK